MTTSPPGGLTCVELLLGTEAGETHPVTTTYPAGSMTVLDATRHNAMLLWTLAGVAPPRRGSVTIDGVPIRDTIEAARQGIHLIPEENALIATLTALENVMLPGLLSGSSAGQHQSMNALEAVGLEDVADNLVEELSGGQQQRTAIARALAANARVILAHEPTSSLDATNRHRVLQLFKDRAREGVTVIMTSNDPDSWDIADGGHSAT